MRVLLQIGTLAIVVLVGTAARGNNNLFLPGDAFFPTVLTEEGITQLQASATDPPVFEYSSLGGYEGAFCGYAGYARAKCPNLEQAFVDNLKRAYRYVRQHYEDKALIETERDGNKTLRETNGVRVMFYPQKFKFPKFKLGLQYNENWLKEVMKFGHPAQQMRLCCLVDRADAVMESWRDSTSVAALEAELPDVELKPVPETTEPVVLTGKLKAYVLDSRPLAQYFCPTDDDMVSLLKVDSSGIIELSYRDGKWERKKIEE